MFQGIGLGSMGSLCLGYSRFSWVQRGLSAGVTAAYLRVASTKIAQHVSEHVSEFLYMCMVLGSGGQQHRSGIFTGKLGPKRLSIDG